MGAAFQTASQNKGRGEQRLVIKNIKYETITKTEEKI